MFVPTGGFLLNTVQFGSGPAFLAHGGWVGSWELWQQPFELMQTRWRCIGYDHRGAGASTFPPEAITAQGLVDDLFSVLDHFEVERCVLAGESLGALTCLQAVLRDPNRFDGLVLVDGSPAATPERTGGLVSGSRQDYPATVRAFVDACVPEDDSDHVRRWGRQVLLRADGEAAARMFEAHYGVDVLSQLEKVDQPVLVLHGEQDVIVSPAIGEAVAAALPRGEYVEIPGAGHVPTLTRPHEVVTAIEQWAAAEGLAG